MATIGLGQKVGDQPGMRTNDVEGREDGWLGSMEDQEFFLNATSPYITLRYRPGPVKRRRRSLAVMENDILEMDGRLCQGERWVTKNKPTY